MSRYKITLVAFVAMGISSTYVSDMFCMNPISGNYNYNNNNQPSKDYKALYKIVKNENKQFKEENAKLVNLLPNKNRGDHQKLTDREVIGCWTAIFFTGFVICGILYEAIRCPR